MWVDQGSCVVLAMVVTNVDEHQQHHGTEEVLLLLVTMTTGVYQSVLCQTLKTWSTK